MPEYFCEPKLFFCFFLSIDKKTMVRASKSKKNEASVEVPETCSISHGHWRATPLVSIRCPVVCRLMRECPYFSFDLLTY